VVQTPLIVDFISQYCLANSGTEVPIRYHRWCAVALLAATLGRRGYIDHKHFVLYPWFYLSLVGSSSIAKTTAMNLAKAMFLRCFPNFPLGAAISSREQIIKYMSSLDCQRTYQGADGQPIDWRPYACFVNELSNFMSFNPGNMIEFLTDIFDHHGSPWKSGTIARNVEPIPNPYLFLIGCTTPGYIINSFKVSIMAGGWARRMLYAYETEEVAPANRITFPMKSKVAYIAEAWCDAHLTKIEAEPEFQFTFAPDAQSYLHEWNTTRTWEDDEILGGYHKNKVNTVQKIAMCLAYAKPTPSHILTKEDLALAIAFLQANEDNLPKLVVAAGRNELAYYQMKLIEFLEKRGGWIGAKTFLSTGRQNLTENEFDSTVRLMERTDQIIRFTHPSLGAIVALPWKAKLLEEEMKNGDVRSPNATNAEKPTP